MAQVLTPIIRDPQKSSDGKRVNVPIDIGNHRFQAVFLRLTGGGVSNPSMHVAGLADNPHKGEIEAAFWEAARRYRQENENALDGMLPPAA